MDEMTKLRNALDNAGIKWKNKTDPFLHVQRTRFSIGKTLYSVITGPIAYGGDKGLLESMPPIHAQSPEFYDDVEGYLTAQDIIEALF